MTDLVPPDFDKPNVVVAICDMILQLFDTGLELGLITFRFLECSVYRAFLIILVPQHQRVVHTGSPKAQMAKRDVFKMDDVSVVE